MHTDNNSNNQRDKHRSKQMRGSLICIWATVASASLIYKYTKVCTLRCGGLTEGLAEILPTIFAREGVR